MKTLLTRIGIPVAGAGLSIGALFAAVKLRLVSDEVSFWLWPTLIAFLFLAASILALLRRARPWLWPLVTGFVVQTTGTLILLLTDLFGDRRWEPLWWTLGVVGLVLLIMLAAFVISTVRARMLEKKMAEGSGGTEAELARIRKDMQEALDLLRRAGRGRNAIYELPWFLVMGRPAAGKTVAIKNSELGLPVKRDWVKGVGGTYTADWFFTNELIFLDTPGKWVTEGASEEGEDHWRELVRLLRRYRGRQPLDGLVVVVPADDLLTLRDDEIEVQAGNIRDVIDLIHEELEFRFPIYILISKCDLVEGFVDFFRALPTRRRHEILGWSSTDPNDPDVPAMIRAGFRRVQRRLEAYRMEMLARVASRSQARRLFFFTEEFHELERPLSVFADAFFHSDRYRGPTPVFRGFYFTSGTQEGTPLSRATAELARTLGVPAPRPQEAGEEEAKRSYFLLDLFRELMIGDEGLVGRTAGHWWRRRRNTLFGVFLPAALALAFVLFAVIALGLNKRTYSAIALESPAIAAELNDRLRESEGLFRKDALQEGLELTGRLRGYHVQMAGFQPFRTFGMRRPGELEAEAFSLFSERFERVILEPTLAEAARLASDPEGACIDKIGLLRSVVWLRTGRRAGYEDLAGLDRVWGLEDDLYSEQAVEVRKEFRQQYVYLKRYLGDGDEENQRLLPGFSVREVARSIRDDCGRRGMTSTLEQYRQFQEDCRQRPTPAVVQSCYQKLHKVLRTRQEDYERLRRDFEGLKGDLEGLLAEVPEAKIALGFLDDVDLSREEISDCLTRFDKIIIPAIKDYADREKSLQQCRDEVANASDRGAKYRARDAALKEQAAAFQEQDDFLKDKFADYSLVCGEEIPGFRRLDMDLLRSVTTEYHKMVCYPGFTVSAPVASRRTGPIPPPPPPQPTPPAAYTLFAAPATVSAAYTPGGCERQLDDWSAQLAALEGEDAIDAHGRAQVREAAASYARNAHREWMAYIGSLELNEPTPPVSAWLMDLATTPEFGRIIDAARKAADIGKSASEPPFDIISSRMELLQPLARLELAVYQNLLRDIAGDLERCEQDSTAWQEYRTEVNEKSNNNSLIRALDWVRINAGPTLVDGKLTALFQAPLDHALEFVLSPNLLRRQWDDMSRLYNTGLKGMVPFDGGVEGRDPASFKSIKALLGGETGAVARVRGAAAGEGLPPQASAWLEEAEALSGLLFQEGTDLPRAISIMLQIGEESYDPEQFGKNFRLEGIVVHLAEGARLEWSKDDEPAHTLKLKLIGDEASVYSFIEGHVAERKGPMGRMFGKKWKPGEGVDAARTEGPMAPLYLIARGRAAGDGNQLRYTLEVPWKEKKGKMGEVRLAIQLGGKDASPLLHLMDRGLPPPPPLTGN